MTASHMFHRNLTASYPTAVGGSGIYLTDADGKTYLDASGGAAVSCLGHGHPRLIDAIKRQAEKMAFAHTAFFTNEPAEQLAEWLCARAPDGFGRAYFVSGGSEANEAALKLARQVQLERGQGSRDYFISRRQSYHGNTLGALAVSGNPARRKFYEPILAPNVRHIDPVYAYRHQHLDEDEEAYGLRAASALEREIERLGAERVIAFIAETVVGATMGAVPPVTGYFKAIREICDRHGVLMILDEVMSGMGRTGRLYACLAEGVVPDMITFAKGLGGGYQPIGAVLVREDLVQIIEQGAGMFQHGHTYMGHALACAAALEVQKTIEDDQLLTNVIARGEDLRALLTQRFGQHPNVGDIRGRGLFVGLELVRDREKKTPFSPTAKLSAKIKSIGQKNGLICYPGSGTVDGAFGDHILLAPPFIITTDQLEELTDKLELTLAAALDAPNA